MASWIPEVLRRKSTCNLHPPPAARAAITNPGCRVAVIFGVHFDVACGLFFFFFLCTTACSTASTNTATWEHMIANPGPSEARPPLPRHIHGRRSPLVPTSTSRQPQPQPQPQPQGRLYLSAAGATTRPHLSYSDVSDVGSVVAEKIADRLLEQVACLVEPPSSRTALRWEAAYDAACDEANGDAGYILTAGAHNFDPGAQQAGSRIPSSRGRPHRDRPRVRPS